MAFSVGQTIHDYQILDIVGSGGMGAVYKVRHLISDRIEAMKVVLPDLGGSAELAERFIREIRIQARLTHPNIAALHTAVRFENQLLMIMEYLEGTMLDSHIKHGKINVPLSLELVVQILNALQYAHSMGVIHRDVKPTNIMIIKGGVAKLMDFGLASSSIDQSLTQAGTALGSRYYMSPEQVKGESLDHRSDIYSLGIVLYEMITGVRPINGDTSWSIMNNHLTQAPTAPTVLDPTIPLPLSAAILKALEKNPANRFESATAFAAAVATLRHQVDASSNLNESMLETRVMQAVKEFTPAPLVSSSTPVSNVNLTPTPSSATMIFTMEELSKLKRDLAGFIGPVARIVVDRAAKKAKTLKALYELVAEEVPPGKERNSFLAKRPQ